MATAQATKPPLWRDVRVLRVAGQILFVVIVLFVAQQLFLNLSFNARKQGIDLNFDFLGDRAGFGIGEGIDYSPNETYRKAMAVGLVNTLRVAVPGIVLASLLGLIMGVARLSKNWLVRKIAQVYVETVRNIPVLVIIAVVFLGVIQTLPPIQEGGLNVPGLAKLSNRLVAFTWIRTDGGFGPWLIFIAVGLVAAAVLWRRRTALNERTGEPHRRVRYAGGALLGIALVGYFIAGGPLSIDTPVLEARGFTYEGGLQLTPQLSALLFALVIYTGAFIAEIVRGSIQAVSKGQKEAAEALGLTPFQQLRFVVLPQALRIALPPINSQYLNLTKNSSLAVFIGYPDFSGVMKTVINQSASGAQSIVILLGTYLMLSLTISFVMNMINLGLTSRGER